MTARCAACPSSPGNTVTGTPDAPAGRDDDLLAAGWRYLPIDGAGPGEHWSLPGVVTVDGVQAACAIETLRIKAAASASLADALEAQVQQHRATLAHVEEVVGVCAQHGAGCQSGAVERVQALADRHARLRDAVRELHDLAVRSRCAGPCEHPACAALDALHVALDAALESTTPEGT